MPAAATLAPALGAMAAAMMVGGFTMMNKENNHRSLPRQDILERASSLDPAAFSNKTVRSSVVRKVTLDQTNDFSPMDPYKPYS